MPSFIERPWLVEPCDATTRDEIVSFPTQGEAEEHALRVSAQDRKDYRVIQARIDSFACAQPSKLAQPGGY